MSRTPCPCGSQKDYIDCCQGYLIGQLKAPTAEALMRSRYTAYCQQNLDYLMATHHPSQRKFDDRITLIKSFKTTTWIKLSIIEVSQGQPTDQVGYVEFVAVYRANQVSQLHERSKFIQQAGQWFYVTGDILPPLLPKRNEACWCGSGQKFKQCHGRSTLQL